MSGDLVLGLDLGGTGCRALLADTTGQRHGEGYAGPANPCSSPPGVAAATLGDALAGALAGTDPDAVLAGVAGIAGYAALSDPGTRGLFDLAWARAGLRCPMRVRPDCEAAFAAGTPGAAGALLVAGTGSMAAAIEARRVATRTGGHGWLLGDEGSGFWLGREAVRAALGALQRRHPTAGLLDDVLDDLLAGAARDRDPLVTLDAATAAVYRQAPIRLAGYAPLVCGAAARGDPVADGLVARAATLLADAVLPLCRPGLPVVLAGGLLTGDLTGGTVGARVRQHLTAEGTTDVVTGPDAAAGAAWLAILDAGTADPVAAHDRLTRGRPESTNGCP
ncbi:MAG: ATPase [Pseudonocardiaceae bacterium]|nr:ATPase [Pseudonocardiaceae bacterium]